MNRDLRAPLVALAVALSALVVAQLLDRGSSGSRDAALLVGSLALYVLIPVAVGWVLILTALRLRRSRRPADRR